MIDRPMRICILGGGFGGLYTALRLSQLPWENSQSPEIVLIDKNDRFLFSPLLYELITGEMQTWEIAPPFEELLADTGILFERASVTKIDIESKLIQLDNTSELTYDKLVISMGGKTPLDIVPGARSHAIPFRTLNDAYRLGEKLRLLEQQKKDYIRIAVIGGGYSGVELACKLADRLGEKGRIRLIEKSDSILASSPEFNRETAKKALEERMIWLDLDTEVEKVEADSISLLYKGQLDTVPVDIVLWTVGTQVSELIRSLPIKHNERGLLTTNVMLQAIDNEDIFVLGDVADCRDADGQKVPGTAQAAFQQADYCAWNIWATILDKPMLPFRYQELGEIMALGVDSATISGMGVKLDGPFAYLARRLIYLYRLPTFKHQLTVGLNWITQPIAQLLGDR
ncbi:MAG: NAD(P)/FAD-dependent oxidoreductase [Xenococcaceae cyanobacterium]